MCRWLLDGSEMPGERSNRLLLDSVGYELNGRRLVCEATNSVGSARLAYTLQVECELSTSLDNHDVMSVCILLRIFLNVL